MKRFWAALVLAVATATIAGVRVSPLPLEERLVRIQAEEALPGIFEKLEDEPIEVLATLTDYSEDTLLLLKAQAAVLRHPELARRILPLFGEDPAFREVLRNHGDAALLPIDYFLANEVRTLAAATYVRNKVRDGAGAIRGWWEREDGSQEELPESKPLTATDRGQLAVHFIREEGHDFLGQFRLDPQGRTQWIQTEQILEGLGSLFASGIRELETKSRSGEKIEASDVGWAVVDVASVTGAGFILRAGKATTQAAKATRATSMASRTAAHGTRFVKASRVALKGMRYGKWPAVIGVSVLAAKHPVILVDFAEGLARLLGVPLWLVISLGASLVLTPVCFVAFRILPATFRLVCAAGRLLVGRGNKSSPRPVTVAAVGGN